MVKKTVGWQFTVYLSDDYAIRVKHDYSQARKRISGYLQKKGRSAEEIDKETRQTLANIDLSWDIIKNSNCPPELIANIKQLDEKRFRQDLAINLPTKIKPLLEKQQYKSIERILNDFVEANLTLWRHGIYESTYKLDSYGYIDNIMALIDPFELCNDIDFIREQLKAPDWRRICQRYRYPARLENYIEQVAKKCLSLVNFEKIWETKKDFRLVKGGLI